MDSERKHTNLFIGFSSAVEYWRSPNAQCRSAASGARPGMHCAATFESVRSIDFAGLGVRKQPLHVIVPDASTWRHSKSVKCHIWKAPDRSKSFVRAGDGLFISSPEACFLQMATCLHVVDLVRFGFELCGSYAIDSEAEDGFRKRPAITSASRLRRFADAMTGRSGCKNARRAAGVIVDGSASPRETTLTMLLCLPRSMGGYGLPFPVLNHRVATGRFLQGAGSAFRVCDLYWNDARLAVEYDSDAYHTGSERIARDSKRRSELELAGIAVISVTNEQVLDAREVDIIAQLIERRLAGRRDSRRADLLARRFELRRRLLIGGSADTMEGEGGACKERDDG